MSKNIDTYKKNYKKRVGRRIDIVKNIDTFINKVKLGTHIDI